MATVVALVCECGCLLHVYVPKVRLYGWSGLDSPEYRQEAEDADLEDETTGEWKFSRNLARSIGAAFVDGRAEICTCPNCGVVLDLDRLFSIENRVLN
jgi:hypothetical protein